jgi:hypothetical protein
MQNANNVMSLCQTFRLQIGIRLRGRENWSAAVQETLDIITALLSIQLSLMICIISLLHDPE